MLRLLSGSQVALPKRQMLDFGMIGDSKLVIDLFQNSFFEVFHRSKRVKFVTSYLARFERFAS